MLARLLGAARSLAANRARATVLPAIVASVLAAGDALAQRRPVGGAPPASAAQDSSRDRAMLEQRLREGYARLLRRELRLTDDQAERLRTVTARFDAQRRPLFMRERGVREQLREQLGSANPDDARVTSLLDALLRVNRQRLDLLEAEQRELATILSPVQRARYLALQENFRRRLEEQRGRERVPGNSGSLRGRRPPG